MSNFNVKMVTLESVMRTRSFIDGFHSVRKGQPFNYDYATSNAQFAYERGRLFALSWDGDSVKKGQRIRWDAIVAMRNAKREGIMI
jgi:hypothetical protein